MGITPEQAFEAIRVLRPKTQFIVKSHIKSVLADGGMSGSWYYGVDVDWPEGITQWPMPEPKWRVPTDQEARTRPRCRVRDHESEEWNADESRILVAVSTELEFGFYAKHPNNSISPWRYCEIIAEVES